MAGLIEYDRTFTFTSTGASEWVSARFADQHNVLAETAAGSTATVVIEQRRKGGTAVAQVSSSLNLGASALAFEQFGGAFHELRVRVSDLTSTGTIRVQMVGNS